MRDSLLTIASTQYFNRTVALFSGLIYNTPESLLKGKITSKGCIEYQFKVFGSITVLFIEVKLNIGSLSKHLDSLIWVYELTFLKSVLG